MVLASACLFVLTHRLNHSWLSTLEHSEGVSWLFVPAGFRVLLVLVLGWPAALGIALGNLWLDQTALVAHPWQVLSTALASGFGPWLVRLGMERVGLLERDLRHCSGHDLVNFVLLYAATNALLHQAIRWLSHPGQSQPWIDVWPMFMGDLNGALLVLGALWLAVRYMGSWRRNRT